MNKLTLTLGDTGSALFSDGTDLWRGLGVELAAIFRRLHEQGTLVSLQEKHLIIDSELSDKRIEGFDTVIKHRRIPFVVYPEEWSASMYKDAALCVLELEMELAALDLTLWDPHPWNVMFDGPRPVWVDFGSVRNADYRFLWIRGNEFIRFFLYPLRLFAAGHGHIVRACINGCSEGIDTRVMLGLSGLRYALPASLKWHGTRLLRALLSRKREGMESAGMGSSHKRTRQDRLAYLRCLKIEIERLEMPTERTAWSHYTEKNFPAFDKGSEWTGKHESFADIMAACKPRTILDIGANSGWYAEYAARGGATVVATDFDEACVDGMYKRLSKSAYCVFPAVLDIRNPTPAKGLNYKFWPSAVERFHVDMVVALALVHHLVFKHWLGFDQIVKALSAFARDTLLVEFVGRDDEHVKKWIAPKYGFYTEDNFLSVLHQHYRSITAYPSNLKDRKLFLCRELI